MKKEMEDPNRRKKDDEKKDRRSRKEKKGEEPTVKIGLDVDVEEPKVIKRPPKRGGCTSSGSSGVSGPGIKLGLDIDVDPGGRKKESEVVAKRPIKAGEVIGPGDVIEREVSRKGRNALDRDQVVGSRATRGIGAGETVRQGMTK